MKLEHGAIKGRSRGKLVRLARKVVWRSWKFKHGVRIKKRE